MFGKIIVSILLIFAIVCFPVFAKNTIKKVKPAQKSVLILKDSSDMEKIVARILQDTLIKLGYQVKEVELADVGKEKASSYDISIIFSAVNAGEEVDPRVQKYMDSKGTTKSKIYVFTVYGRIYNQKDENVDATTQATKDLHTDLIAQHILQSLKP